MVAARGVEFDEILIFRAAADELERLDNLINSPQVESFLSSVRFEAAHQVERWGEEHDRGKSPQDWFWLIGYLAGKALHNAIEMERGGDFVNAATRSTALHHTISTAAVLLNWHAHLIGDRPGVAPGHGQPLA